MENNKPGKKPVLDHEAFKQLLLDKREKIVIDGKIVTVTNSSVWKNLESKLGVTASTLYSYAVSKRYGYRDLLLGIAQDKSIDTTASSLDTSFNSPKLNYSGDYFFKLSKSRFKKLVLEKVCKAGNNKTRKRTILVPHEWEETVQEYLWNIHKIPHGFNFDDSSLTRDAGNGKIKGHCNCQGTIEIEIDNESDDLHAIFYCHIKKGVNENCKPRQLRASKRQKVGEHLDNHSVDAYVSQERRKYQRQGEPNPPIVYKEAVLHTAKYEYRKSQYRDEDPIKALKLLKRSSIGIDVIRDIGCDPFFVYVFSTHQIRLFNMYSNECPLLLDSTTGIARKLDILENVKSHTLSLHLGVIKCAIGQIAVFSGITERQDTISTELLLKRFFQRGENFPKHVVTDQGRTLQSSVILCCTNFKTVEDYCDGFYKDGSKMKDTTLLTIDVNHYIKDWAVFFKSLAIRGVIKTFYMASIGELVMSKTLKEARHLIKLIMMVALSETDGMLENVLDDDGNPVASSTENAYQELKARITGKEDVYEEFLEDCQDSDGESSEAENSSFSCSDDDNGDEGSQVTCHSTSRSRSQKQFKDVNPKSVKRKITEWEQWGLRLENRVDKKIKRESGDHLNARVSPLIVKRLIKEIRHIPMWSCIFNRKFQCTIVKPSSSASVECEIKKVKRNALNGQGKTLRVDRSVELIVKYYDGKLRILPSEKKTTPSDSNCNDQSNAEKSVPICDLGDNSNMDHTESSHGVHDLAAEKNTNSQNSEYNEISSQSADADDNTEKESNQDFVIEKENIPVYDTLQSRAQILRDKTDKMQSQPLRDISNDTECPACRNGHEPPGGHHCGVCLRKVHAIVPCSFPFSSDSEDEGQLRLCLSCSKKKDVDKHITMNEIENHKGHALRDLNKENKSRRRKNLYLGESREKIGDALMYGNENNTFKRLPLIKRGSDPNLALIRIDDASISLRYTCPIDSTFQIYLVACTDYPWFAEHLKQKSNVKEEGTKTIDQLFQQLVLATLSSGITAKVYKLRALVMIAFKNIEVLDKAEIDCSCDIGDFVKQMNKNEPSLRISKSCKNQCGMAEDIFESLFMNIYIFQNKRMLQNYVNKFFDANSLCTNSACKYKEIKTVVIEPLISIQLYGMDVTKLKMKLSSIPKNFEINGDCYLLVGFINFYGNDIPVDTNEVNHYTAICYRGNNWIEYDDQQEKPIQLKQTFVVEPKVVFYIKKQH